MDYTREFFDPEKRGGLTLNGQRDTISFSWTLPRGEKDVYVFEPRVTLAINVALATERPLLIAGEPGSGKTRLAAAVAEILDWQFYAKTVTSRTQATDLLWSFEALRRLNDATTPGHSLKEERYYVTPGHLWWGLSPTTAAQRGLRPLTASAPVDANPVDPNAKDPAPSRAGKGAVVLIDEIDKADPDVPNDLLEPFDVRRFTVKETNETIVKERDVFLVLTTNGERELPPAFLRRCVVLALANPDKAWLERIARQHFPNGDVVLHRRVAAEVQRLRDEAPLGARKPSTAEFIDALKVCEKLRLQPQGATWREVVDNVLLKREQVAAASVPPGAAAAGTDRG